MSNCSPGSSAAYAYERMYASARYPSVWARSSLISNTALAPSVSGDEFPAVTLPYRGSNTGFNARSCSIDVSVRIPLSLVKAVS